MFKACGHFLIIELSEAESETFSDGGIIISKDKKKEQLGMTICKVVDVGRNCWTGFTDPDGNWEAWCQAEDNIMIAQYAGQAFPVDEGLPLEEQTYIKRLRLIKDDDVLARVE